MPPEAPKKKLTPQEMQDIYKGIVRDHIADKLGFAKPDDPIDSGKPEAHDIGVMRGTGAGDGTTVITMQKSAFSKLAGGAPDEDFDNKMKRVGAMVSKAISDLGGDYAGYKSKPKTTSGVTDFTVDASVEKLALDIAGAKAKAKRLAKEAETAAGSGGPGGGGPG